MNILARHIFIACAIMPRPLAGGTQPVINSIATKLVPVDPGPLAMRQDGAAADYPMSKHPAEFNHADWDEKPAHKVAITQPFHIGATEVTLGQYRQFKPKHRERSSDDEGDLVRRVRVLRMALEEGRQKVSPADGGGMGICAARAQRRCSTRATL